MWIVCFVVGLAIGVEDLDHFNTGFFQNSRESGLYEITVGLEKLPIVLAAFGYFNSDKL